MTLMVVLFLVFLSQSKPTETQIYYLEELIGEKRKILLEYMLETDFQEVKNVFEDSYSYDPGSQITVQEIQRLEDKLRAFEDKILKGETEAPDDMIRTLHEFNAEINEYKKNFPSYQYGLIPEELNFHDLITYMFLHGSWLHLIGNLFFLWLAGYAMEDAWGRSKFILLYLLFGVGAGLAQVAVSPGSDIPIVGASGAIAGLMGAFMITHRQAKIKFFWFFLLIGWGVVHIPAKAALLFWFIRELSNALLSSTVGEFSSVAFWAHVGGFAIGGAAAYLLKSARHASPAARSRSKNPLVANAVKRDLAIARTFEQAGNYDMAENFYRRVLAQQPGNIDADQGLKRIIRKNLYQ